MKKKSSEHRKGLPKEAVLFVRHLIDAGFSPADFAGFNHLREYSGHKWGQLQAAWVRLDPKSGNHLQSEFAPIILDWTRKAEEPQWTNMNLSGRNRVNLKGVSRLTTQLQPALPETKVTVLQVVRSEPASDLLQSACRYRMGDVEKKQFEYLRANRIGLGLVHAKKVAQELAVNTRENIFGIPLCGAESIGKSIFYLLDYIAYDDVRDEKGKPAFAWMETRVISKNPDSNGGHLIVDFHEINNVMIPEGALIVLGNINWFEGKK